MPALSADEAVTVSFFAQDGQSCGAFDFLFAKISGRFGYVIENKNLAVLFPVLNGCMELRP